MGTMPSIQTVALSVRPMSQRLKACPCSYLKAALLSHRGTFVLLTTLILPFFSFPRKDMLRL